MYCVACGFDVCCINFIQSVFICLLVKIFSSKLIWFISVDMALFMEDLRLCGGWSGGAMMLGKLTVPGRSTIWITVGQGPTAHFQ